MRNIRRTKKKVNAIVNEILNEDQEDNFNGTRSEACPGGCEQSENTIKEAPRQCNCAVENSLRFSLRVMEAMRSLQRDVDQSFTSTTEEIVDYIRANYRSDGDLYAQVRTALRQVCSQGLFSNRFVIKLLDNEYHWIGPIARSTKQNGCSLDCTGCTSESLRRTSVVDRLEDRIAGPILHSTRISANEIDNADYRDREINSKRLSPVCNYEDIPDVRDDHRHGVTQTREIEQRDEFLSPIPGPSREIVTTLVSPRNARKKTRLGDRKVKRADDNDEETTTEEDLDCTCDARVAQVDRDTQLSKRLPDRTHVVRDRRNSQQNSRHHEGAEDEEEEEDEEKEDENEKKEEEEDTDTEDSVYRQLRRRSPRRTRARERELKRWIRRCREECERRRLR
ncbi:uncharacterized protein LOC113562270 [Ooceraea biroi]|uniref:uncharacterized protein LOC113562270 n=1 Tax=Ooceraea biroi TaxID=2015173 RepID=UPI000F07BB7E|nr:uncharacterized protein LOC113562270 [Ooceraea biroi]